MLPTPTHCCYLLLLLLVLTGCGKPGPSPEEMLVRYVQLVNQGQLAVAKQWCTPAGVAHLEALEAVMEATDIPVDSTAVQVQVQHCQETATGLRCEVEISDGFGPHHETYDLVLTSDGWRVDQAGAGGATETYEEVLPLEPDSQ